ncbi:MAG: hypothetical protein ACLQDQ_18365 [Myxococcaceae bacterium]
MKERGAVGSSAATCEVDVDPVLISPQQLKRNESRDALLSSLTGEPTHGIRNLVGSRDVAQEDEAPLDEGRLHPREARLAVLGRTEIGGPRTQRRKSGVIRLPLRQRSGERLCALPGRHGCRFDVLLECPFQPLVACMLSHDQPEWGIRPSGRFVRRIRRYSGDVWRWDIVSTARLIHWTARKTGFHIDVGWRRDQAKNLDSAVPSVDAIAVYAITDCITSCVTEPARDQPVSGALHGPTLSDEERRRLREDIVQRERVDVGRERLR